MFSFAAPYTRNFRVRQAVRTVIPKSYQLIHIRHVIIPDNGASLIRKELSLAFAAQGISSSSIDPARLRDSSDDQSLASLLQAHEHCLFLSVNFQGLEQMKPTLEVLEKHGARAAVWCVDNPWNLLAGVRDPRWRTLPLFVTDSSFVKPLRVNGATVAHFLPLAACEASFAPNPARDKAFPPPEDLAPVVFAGRSAFPGKEDFFAGLHLPLDISEEARAMLAQGKRPHLHWWEERLGVHVNALWPGKTARLPAWGAEESSLQWRSLCLAQAAAAGWNITRTVASNPGVTPKDTPGLDIFGDEGWHTCLPDGANLRPPVDYYARLPGIYAAARYSLALTSLQLPAGLNQRHFDVWMAGGFCITDNTPGLSLFPDDLTQPVTFSRPKDISRLLLQLEKKPSLRQSLQREWRDHIRQRHTYRHRAERILEALDHPGIP